MPKFLHVGLNFQGAPKIKELEAGFSSAGDWMRYSSHCWLLWTERSAQDVFNILKPYLAVEDQFLVLEVNMNERNGWMPEWVWNWMNERQRYQTVSPFSGVAAFGQPSPLGVGPANPFYPPPWLPHKK